MHSDIQPLDGATGDLLSARLANGFESAVDAAVEFDRDICIAVLVIALTLVLRWYNAFKERLFSNSLVALARHGCRRVGHDPIVAVRAPLSVRLLAVLDLSSGPRDAIFAYLDATSAVHLAACGRVCARAVIGWTRAQLAMPHRHDARVSDVPKRRVPTADDLQTPFLVADQVPSGAQNGAAADKIVSGLYRDEAEHKHKTHNHGCDYEWMQRVVLRTDLMRDMPPVHRTVFACAHMNAALWFLATPGTDAASMARDTACVGPSGAWPLAVDAQGADETSAHYIDRDNKVHECAQRTHTLPLVHFPLASLDTRVPLVSSVMEEVAKLLVASLVLLGSDNASSDIVCALLGCAYVCTPPSKEVERLILVILRACTRHAATYAALPVSYDRITEAARGFFSAVVHAIEDVTPEFVLWHHTPPAAATSVSGDVCTMLVVEAVRRTVFAHLVNVSELLAIHWAAGAALALSSMLQTLCNAAASWRPIAARIRRAEPPTLAAATIAAIIMYTRHRCVNLVIIAAMQLPQIDAAWTYVYATFKRICESACAALGLRLWEMVIWTIKPYARRGAARLTALRLSCTALPRE